MFQLSKWYLDCVTDEGAAVILYRATVHWGPLRFHYGASLHVHADGAAVQRQTFRPGNDIAVRESAIHWASPNLQVSGDWTGTAIGFQQRLLDGPEGKIHWHCLIPGGSADVRSGDSRLTGSGYVEHLVVTVKPWRLPFDELRWGRFVGRSGCIVWIQWRGTVSRTWAWRNGAEQTCCNVDDERIEFASDGLSLDLSNTTVLRSGLLDSTALRSVRALTRLIPGWRSAHETKWLARGELNQAGRSDKGWAIHEIVRWV